MSLKNLIKGAGNSLVDSLVILHTPELSLAKIDIGGELEAGILRIMQRRIGIDLRYIFTIYRKSHRRALTLRHIIEVYIALFTAHPRSTDKIGSESHKPAVGIIICRTGLASRLSGYIEWSATETVAGTAIDYIKEH